MRPTMPVEIVLFTADRRIHGFIPLADDRLSDMLNSVPRVVMRGSEVHDLLEDGPPHLVDSVIPIGAIVAVLATGRRGIETRRRRTHIERVKVGIVRYVITGSLHVPAGMSVDVRSTDPAKILAGRDLLVPFTDATITYDHGSQTLTEPSETILINRTLATWMEIDDGGGNDGDLLADRPKVYHAAMAKDFTGAS
jgi:hypothetical protein